MKHFCSKCWRSPCECRTLPLALVTSTRAGDDVEVREIEDCTEVYGDWPEIDTPCDDSPVGQCVYNSVALDHDRCIYCKKVTG